MKPAPEFVDVWLDDFIALLTVKERFQLSGPGLTIVPDFPLPEGFWENCLEKVLVLKPEGETFEALAHFNATHFNVKDINIPIEKRWRVVVSLPETEKENVPIGSKILVSIEIRNAICGNNHHE